MGIIFEYLRVVIVKPLNASDYCVFYYNPQYLPPKRRYSKRDISGYQPKSGTQLAFDYANQRKKGGKIVEILNVL